MHRHGTESIEALAEARANAEAFAMFSVLIGSHWKQHNTLVGFAMDHGCHDIDGGAGAHGLDMDEDMNIVHLYQNISHQSIVRLGMLVSRGLLQ